VVEGERGVVACTSDTSEGWASLSVKKLMSSFVASYPERHAVKQRISYVHHVRLHVSMQ